MRLRPALVVFVALWLAASCLDISSPVSGIVAITPVIAPTPSVVTGDVSRDSLGEIKPLRVYAFAPNGDTVKDAVVRFISTDTTGQLKVDSVSGIATGGNVSLIASVIARVSPANGSGFLETPRLLLPVVPVPITIALGSNPGTFTFDALQTDTLSSSLLSPSLTATVRSDPDTVEVPSYLVSYELIDWPGKGQPGLPSVLLVNDNNRPSMVDTTDGQGNASRKLRVRLQSMPTAVLTGGTDTAIVRVTVRYRGAPRPPKDFIVPIRGG